MEIETFWHQKNLPLNIRSRVFTANLKHQNRHKDREKKCFIIIFLYFSNIFKQELAMKNFELIEYAYRIITKLH